MSCVHVERVAVGCRAVRSVPNAIEYSVAAKSTGETFVFNSFDESGNKSRARCPASVSKWRDRSWPRRVRNSRPFTDESRVRLTAGHDSNALERRRTIERKVRGDARAIRNNINDSFGTRRFSSKIYISAYAFKQRADIACSQFIWISRNDRNKSKLLTNFLNTFENPLQLK